MPRVPDVTETTPQRRMSVARGRVEGLQQPPTAEQLGAAKAAAVLASKDATRLLPGAVPFSLTDAFCDLAAEPATGSWSCTMTVQGYARAHLSASAMAGVCAALLSLAESTRSAKAVLREVAVVQDVVA